MRTLAVCAALGLTISLGLAGCTSETVSCDAAVQRAHATIEARDIHTGAELWSTTTPWLHGARYDPTSGELTAYPYGRNNGPTHIDVSLVDGDAQNLSGPAPFARYGPLVPVTGEGVTVTIQQPAAEGTAPARGPATAVATSGDGTQLWTYELARPNPTQPLVAGDRVVLISNDQVATRCP